MDQEAERKRKLQEEVLRREEEAKRRMAKVTKESRTDIAKREVRGLETNKVTHTCQVLKIFIGNFLPIMFLYVTILLMIINIYEKEICRICI